MQTSIHNCYSLLALGVPAELEAYIVVARQHISQTLSSVSNCMEYLLDNKTHLLTRHLLIR